MNKKKLGFYGILIVFFASIFFTGFLKHSGSLDQSTATESLNNGLHFVMSEPNKWRDPHGLVIIGCMKNHIVEQFGEVTYHNWLLEVSKALCFSNDSFGVGVDALDYPDYPEDPTCLGYPDGHETAVAIIGMNEAGLTELNGHSLEELTNWLKYYPDYDQYSIGIRIQALLYGGVTLNETWQTADNRTVSIKSLMDDAIDEWRKEKEVENLSAGDLPKDLLLHLAPSLIVFKHKYPIEFIKYGYPTVLEEVFAFYESLMVDNEYWGFEGETYATGHILEHYTMDHRNPKSMKGLEYMIKDQASDGMFNLSNAKYLGAQVHGMKGLYRCMQDFNFDY